MLLMQPSETGRSYDTLAQGWQERMLQSNYGVAQFERAIKFTKGRKHALDIGCGSSGRIVDLLARHGFEVEGIDVSEKMIELARKERPQVSFSHADIRTWDFPRKYDFISAWDSIWHLPMADHEPVLKKICDGMTQDGVFLFTMGGLELPNEKTNSCMGPPLYHCTLGIPRTLELLTQFGVVCRHLEYDQFPEKHVYIIAQKNGGAPEE